ncbi:hypothetical protein [Trujillonella endophytica]|uniref:Uncharacterized protein n=1 Tax=Trujillonella endophytica TaxID=673521 RepID=A0A1H8VYS6_9ACTN|nr:hypothetical protein [Trujillella endophytica]SEP20490.1 hypothetical protein SAMN05660991_03912 [Trujillella endophytica]
MQATDGTTSTGEGTLRSGVDPERRRQAWRRIVTRQLACLCARAQGSDPAARDAAARAARLAALLERDENGALYAR